MHSEIVMDDAGTQVSVFRLQDSLDIASAWRFKLRLKETLRRKTPHIVVNLSQVKFIDSSGLTALVLGMRATANNGGSFRLAAIHPEALPVFELTDMHQVFAIFACEESAIHTPRCPSP
jgi:anti-sigma B factor antagonist